MFSFVAKSTLNLNGSHDFSFEGEKAAILTQDLNVGVTTISFASSGELKFGGGGNVFLFRPADCHLEQLVGKFLQTDLISVMFDHAFKLKRHIFSIKQALFPKSRN